jgi:hypothetical protein
MPDIITLLALWDCWQDSRGLEIQLDPEASRRGYREEEISRHGGNRQRLLIISAVL